MIMQNLSLTLRLIYAGPIESVSLGEGVAEGDDRDRRQLPLFILSRDDLEHFVRWSLASRNARKVAIITVDPHEREPTGHHLLNSINRAFSSHMILPICSAQQLSNEQNLRHYAQHLCELSRLPLKEAGDQEIPFMPFSRELVK